ncbi:MAG: hypothetical protein LUH10_00390 [Tannerellaceae bacterium]|nr:hypothetical protein [Tannerellaceae bacterium]
MTVSSYIEYRAQLEISFSWEKEHYASEELCDEFLMLDLKAAASCDREEFLQRQHVDSFQDWVLGCIEFWGNA